MSSEFILQYRAINNFERQGYAMVCNRCGIQLQEGTGFCPNCGTKMVVNSIKSKAGIPIALFAAGMYAIGMFSTLGLILIAGYVLIAESDTWLRRSAMRAVGTITIFAVLPAIVSVGFSGFRILHTMIGWVTSTSVEFLNFILSFEIMFGYVVSGIQTIVLLVLAVKALSLRESHIPVVDKLINRFGAM